MSNKLQLVTEIRQYVYQYGLDATIALYGSELECWQGEPAGIWLRVSSGKQDEANQLPEVLEYCAKSELRPAKWYVLHDKSANRGEQQGKLDEMVNDMRNGVIVVGVCWKSSRMERRGPRFTFRLLAQVADAGCDVKSVSQPQWGTGGVAGQTLTSLYAAIDQDFSETLAENVKLSYDRIRANGAVGPGGTPWGIQIVGAKYEKKFEFTDLCRKWAPEIFTRRAAGDSWHTIAVWLDSQGIPPKKGNKWSEGSVRKLIRNRVYAGRWQNEAKTKTLHIIPNPPVRPELWEQAQGIRRPRGPVNEKDRPMLAGLKCNRCEDSPMYRHHIHTRSGEVYRYYRCAGRGAQRKGCGNMLPYDLLDTYVYAWVLLTAKEPHMIRTWIEGKNWESEKHDVKQDMREALEANDFAKLRELEAQFTELDNRKATKGYWDEIDSGITKGRYFHSLDRNGQREHLRAHDTRAEKDPRYADGIRLVIDGKDVTPLIEVNGNLSAALAAKGERGSWGQRLAVSTVSES